MSLPLAYESCVECSNLHRVGADAPEESGEFLEKQWTSVRNEALRQASWDVMAHTDRWPEKLGYVRTGPLAQKALDTCQGCDGHRPAMADLLDATVMIAVPD